MVYLLRKSYVLFKTGVYKVAYPPAPSGGNRIKLFGKKIKWGRREWEGKREEGKKGRGRGNKGRKSEERIREVKGKGRG